MTKTVLITGSTGLLGRQVTKSFQRADWKVVGTGFSRASPPTIKLDLNNPSEVTKTIEDIKPDVIVHCAANRFPDKCDTDPIGTKALNITATSTLSQICAEKDILLIYISTDYVFPGTEGQAPYQVTDTPSPPNLYGETKHDGEKEVLKTLGKGKGVILRVPVLYGEAETNKESAVNVLMDTVLKVGNEGAEVKMDHWAIRYPTNTEDVARVLQDIASLYLSKPSDSLPHILQFSSEDKMTKYEICQLFAEIQGLPLDTLSPNTEGNDPKAAVQRPYDCHLSSKALEDLGIGVETMDFKGWWRRECRAFRK